MKVSQAQVEENRQRMLRAAARQFKVHGFDGISIGDITREAGLTHGVFYRHFASKDDLAEKTVTALLATAAERWEHAVSQSPDAPLGALRAHYLTHKKMLDVADGCVIAALCGDIPRQRAGLRAAFTAGLKGAVNVIARRLSRGTAATRKRRALAAITQAVGAMVLARAVDDAQFAKIILESPFVPEQSKDG